MGKIFFKPPILEDYIFNKTPDELLQKAVPPLGIEYHDPIFKKYGYSISGICDGWQWKKDLSEASVEEKLYMAAVCNEYWLQKYSHWLDKIYYKEYKEDLREWGKKRPEFLETLKKLEEQE